MAASTLTAQDIIYRAARILKVAALDETPSAAVSAEMLTLLNGMLNNWSAKGLSTYTHTTLTLSSTMATDNALDLGLPYLLAVMAANDFEAIVTPDMAAIANECANDARKLYVPWATTTLDIDTGLKRMPGEGAQWILF
jgi:hypothetical protein